MTEEILNLIKNHKNNLKKILKNNNTIHEKYNPYESGRNDTIKERINQELLFLKNLENLILKEK